MAGKAYKLLAEKWKGVVSPKPDHEEWGLFPNSLKTVMLLLLLLLLIYVLFTGSRLEQVLAPGFDGGGLNGPLQSLTGQLRPPLETAKSALLRNRPLLEAKDGADFLDGLEKIVREAGPMAKSAALFQTGQLIAATNPGDQESLSLAAKQLLWQDGKVMASLRSGNSLYLAVPLSSDHGTEIAILSLDLSGIALPKDTGSYYLLVDPDGYIFNLANPDKASSEAKTLEDVFGISKLRLGKDQIGQIQTEDRSQTTKFRLRAQTLGDLPLVALAAAPLNPPGSNQDLIVAQSYVTLFVPLGICISLVLLVFRQTRKAEAAFLERREIEKKLSDAVKAANIGVWEWRALEDTVHISDVIAIMLNFGQSCLVSRSEFLSRIIDKDRDKVAKAFREAARSGKIDVSFRAQNAKEEIWITLRGQGVEKTIKDGQYTALLGMALDITEERAAEARAIAAETRLKDAIETISEAFILWDQNNKLVLCNHNYKTFFSLDPVLLRPGTHRDVIQKIADMSIQTQNNITEPGKNDEGKSLRSVIKEMQLADGRWLQVSERRTVDGGIVMTAADITTLKHQEQMRQEKEQDLRQAILRLEQNSVELADLATKYEQEKIRAQKANDSKSEFLANMSHELRTPLNAINGFSEMMAKEMLGPLGDKRYVEYANDVLSSGQHLLSLINDILDMAKIEAGKQVLFIEPVELKSLGQDVMRLMQKKVSDSELELIVDLERLPVIEADRRALKQVLLNLLSNSVKFTPKGGRIKITGEAVAKGCVQISVMDTGIGIPKEDISRLAKPFAQVENQQAKTRQGSGLGLALSKSLIEMHDGRLQIASETGRGTTVSILIPIRHKPKSPEPDPKHIENLENSQTDHSDQVSKSVSNFEDLVKLKSTSPI